MLQAIFIILPDSQFSKDGVGASSKISYGKLFFQYKCLFINNWETPYLVDLISKINGCVFSKSKTHLSGAASMVKEDLMADIDAAMAAMALPAELEADTKSQDANTNLFPAYLSVHWLVQQSSLVMNMLAMLYLMQHEFQTPMLPVKRSWNWMTSNL